MSSFRRNKVVGADVPDSPSYTNYLCTIKKFFAPARTVGDAGPYKPKPNARPILRAVGDVSPYE